MKYLIFCYEDGIENITISEILHQENAENAPTSSWWQLGGYFAPYDLPKKTPETKVPRGGGQGGSPVPELFLMKNFRNGNIFDSILITKN